MKNHIINKIAWKKLYYHYINIKNKSLREFFNEEPKRYSKYSIEYDNILLDFSKNHINSHTLNLLLNLVKESNLHNAIEKICLGFPINKTENRSVLHMALRNFDYYNCIYSNKENIFPSIQNILKKMKIFSKNILEKKWKGFTKKIITDIVNIGIGGSQLGPMMVVEALKYYKKNINIHFVSNIDGSEISEILKKLNPENTIFIISSKTFTTEETLTNAITAKEWFLKKAILNKYIKYHFIAISTNKEEVKKFGIIENNIFHFWDWVGGRYSLWGPIGLSICLSIGFDKFEELLKGANKIDQHFINTPFNKNIPVILALLGIWYINFFNFNNHIILPYDQYLYKFPMYIQQVDMESNGKSVNINGEKINYHTGPIIFGDVGTNCQHSFFQFLHQGKSIITSDFIISIKPLNKLGDHHEKLFSNFLSQTSALAFGKIKEEIVDDNKFLIPFKIFEGNRPSNSIILDKLTPYNLGSLIAIYEHKIFVQGVIWNIFSFDQWGVELGKEISKNILYDIKYNKNTTKKYDDSTNELIKIYKRKNNK